MVKEISIQNFKSIIDMNFNPGGFNVLIGENGCGKSNILEAISYGVAASLDKLDNIYLEARGIRVTEPQFMASAFEEKAENIEIIFKTNENFQYLKSLINPFSKDALVGAFTKMNPGQEKIRQEVPIKSDLNDVNILRKKIEEIRDMIGKEDELPTDIQYFNEIASHLSLILYKDETNKDSLKSFTFYCPEESTLRSFEGKGELLPLGVKGHGLLRYIKELSQTEDGQQTLVEIKENLSLLDWFDNLNIPTGSMSGDYTVNIRDKYINDTLQYFDQRSTNEGFLYLLFYLTLFISKDTPSFFAIDNLESSFNPKLCTKIVKVLKDLAQKHNKQVIVTTHSPFILDGLDLKNDEERLFVIRRNDDGHTKIKRIEHKSERTKKLSEIWMSGAIGALPDNF